MACLWSFPLFSSFSWWIWGFPFTHLDLYVFDCSLTLPTMTDLTYFWEICRDVSLAL